MQNSNQPSGQPEQKPDAVPQRDRRYWSGPLQLEQIELGQQLTTKQAEAIVEDLIETDRRFRRTPVKPQTYRPGFRRGD